MIDIIELTTDELIDIRNRIDSEVKTRTNEPCDHVKTLAVNVMFCGHELKTERCTNCLRHSWERYEWWVDVGELRRRILEFGCDHRYTTDYRWEHDNGYGVQKMITGERCLICEATRSWKCCGAWWFDE